MNNKALFFAFIAICFFAKPLIAQERKSDWSLLGPGELETMIQKEGFTIVNAWDGVPIEYDNQVISTKSLTPEGAESLKQEYPSVVTAKVSGNHIEFRLIAPIFQLLSNDIIKTFLCTKNNLPYVLYVGFNAMVYAVPATTYERTMTIYLGVVLDKKLSANMHLGGVSVERKYFDRMSNREDHVLPVNFGYTRNETQQKLGKPSISETSYGSDGTIWDFWNDLGISVCFDLTDAITEIRVSAYGRGENWKKFENRIFGIPLFGDLQDVMDAFGEPLEEPGLQTGFVVTTGKTWIIDNIKLTVHSAVSESKKFYNNRDIYRGSIVAISLREIQPSPMINPASLTDQGYKVCNRFILRNDIAGLTEYMKTKPDIKPGKDQDLFFAFDHPLMLALSMQKYDMFRALLENGADPNWAEYTSREDDFVVSILEYISKRPNFKERIPLYELICKHGVNIEDAVNIGLRLQDYRLLDAVKKAHPDYAKLDLTNILNEKIIFSNLWPIQWLVENGADLNRKSTYGPTLMKMGLSSKYDDVKNYFKQLK